MKTKLLILLAAIVFLLSLGGYLFYKNQHKNDWATFKNETFTFSYPPGWLASVPGIASSFEEIGGDGAGDAIADTTEAGFIFFKDSYEKNPFFRFWESLHEVRHHRVYVRDLAGRYWVFAISEQAQFPQDLEKVVATFRFTSDHRQKVKAEEEVKRQKAEKENDKAKSLAYGFRKIQTDFTVFKNILSEEEADELIKKAWLGQGLVRVDTSTSTIKDPQKLKAFFAAAGLPEVARLKDFGGRGFLTSSLCRKILEKTMEVSQKISDEDCETLYWDGEEKEVPLFSFYAFAIGEKYQLLNILVDNGMWGGVLTGSLLYDFSKKEIHLIPHSRPMSSSNVSIKNEKLYFTTRCCDLGDDHSILSSVYDIGSKKEIDVDSMKGQFNQSYTWQVKVNKGKELIVTSADGQKSLNLGAYPSDPDGLFDFPMYVSDFYSSAPYFQTNQKQDQFALLAPMGYNAGFPFSIAVVFYGPLQEQGLKNAKSFKILYQEQKPGRSDLSSGNSVIFVDDLLMITPTDTPQWETVVFDTKNSKFLYRAGGPKGHFDETEFIAD